VAAGRRRRSSARRSDGTCCRDAYPGSPESRSTGQEETRCEPSFKSF